MAQEETASFFSSTLLRGWLITIGIVALVLALPVAASVNLWYAETKGPYKNLMAVVDLEGDGDLDIVVSHTRWEAVDISWAGVGRWINQGNGTFELLREPDPGSFGGFAAGVGDLDNDGDPDAFIQDYGVRFLQNQGGAQGGESGTFRPASGMNPPTSPYKGYRDMGGSIEMGDLNGDGRLDAFVAGCCYGFNAMRPEDDYAHDPSVSWAWYNEGSGQSLLSGHSIRIEALDGRPVRGTALGDLDGDGDVDIFAAVGRPTMGEVDSFDDVILLNEGSGVLAAFDQPLGDADSTSVALGDVNGDGQLDALVGTSEGARLWINQSSEKAGRGGPIFVAVQGSFSLRRTLGERLGAGLSAATNQALGTELTYGSPRTKGVALSDLDGDGDLDALLAGMRRAEIWWNDGHGGFTRSGQRFEYPEDSGVAVGDFDGDGDADIFAGGNAHSYQVWFNNGKGDFGG